MSLRATIMVMTLSLLTVSATQAAKPDRGPDGTASFNGKGGPNKPVDNEGNWEFNDGSSNIAFEKKRIKGVKQGRLNMDGLEFVPVGWTEMGDDSAFHGDYRGRGVSELTFVARTVEFGPEPVCRPEFLPFFGMSVELRNDGGTPGMSPELERDDCGVMAVLGPAPSIEEGWVNYQLAIPSGDTTMPPNFRISLAGGGCEGLSADQAWNLVMTDVSQVRICWEQCDYFRFECDWHLDLDNISVE